MSPRAHNYPGTALGLCRFLLLALALAACSPPAPPDGPAPGSIADVALKIRTGDMDAYRNAIQKERGLAARGRRLAATLDADAWLVAMGARWREYDLVAASKAMLADDDGALAAALGFGPQAMRTDMVDSASSLYYERSLEQRWVRTTKTPLDWLDELRPMPCRSPLLAYQLSMVGSRDGTVQRVRVGYDLGGLTELCGAEELAPPSLPESPGGNVAGSPAQALDFLAQAKSEFSALRHGLRLTDEPLYKATVLDLHAVRGDGALFEVRFIYRGGWYTLTSLLSSQDERLTAARDVSMRRILDAARKISNSRGRWPQNLSDLTLPQRHLVDATAGDLGWARYDLDAPAGFSLGAPGESEIAVTALKPASDGRRRALTHKGELIWLPK
ncbi:MAG: hypothetical protein IT462_01685 [Planctomycetes bacterium]|nr:hypothetical protein [Planctomycetota bacterium]